MRILVTGQARTGTTALFLARHAAMPPDTLALFEPTERLGLYNLPQHVVVKTLIATLPGDERRPPEATDHFDEVYVLVRDPRDRLISLLLFLPLWSNADYPPLAITAPAGLAQYCALLDQKVAAPARVSTWVLFERLMQLRFGFSHGEGIPTLRALQQHFLLTHAQLTTSITVYFEDLAGPHVGEMLPRPPRAYARILRRGTPGEWRQWFTPRDCEYFRPLFQPYLTWYGYDDDWSLPQEPHIRAQTSRIYLATWLRVDRRRRQHAASAP